MTSLYCVFGHPIGHSRSPFIHQAFATSLGIDLRYEKREVPLDQFANYIASFKAEGGKGANITVPFKQEALALAQHVTPRARMAGAVNTLLFEASGGVVGDNTDGAGLLNDLRRLGVKLKEARIAILGAGGAVRGVIGPLLDAEPRSITIANRTLSRAESLIGDWAGEARLSATSPDHLIGEFDLIINGTSASLNNELPAIGDAKLKGNGWAYDMVYAAEPTPFMQWASSQGAHAADGLGMLVEQAAESFTLWEGVRPAVEPVLEALRADIRHS